MQVAKQLRPRGPTRAPRWRSEFPLEVPATVSIAMFEGLALGRLIDPGAYSQQALTDALPFLYMTIGVNGDPPPT